MATVVAIAVALNHRRKVLRDCEQQLSPKRAEFSQALEKEFAKAIDTFCAEMAKKIRSLSDACQAQLRRYRPWSDRADELEKKLAALKPRLG